MEKVVMWSGMTQTHGFLVEVYRDAKAGGLRCATLGSTLGSGKTITTVLTALDVFC